MIIKTFRLRNYKSFYDSKDIAFESGFNVIVGSNNSGKTALIQGLSLIFDNEPHLSEETLPEPGQPANKLSAAIATFNLTFDEVVRNLATRNARVSVTTNQRDQDRMMPNLAKKLRADGLNISMTVEGEGDAKSESANLGGEAVKTFSFRAQDADLVFHGMGDSGAAEIGQFFGPIIRSRVYAFKAERLNIGSYKFGNERVLATDCSNLPQVLNHLNGTNPHRFDRLVELYRYIFPSIKHISIEPSGSDTVEIKLWTLETRTEREDLAIPLAKSGTGLGQVLAILFVVLDSTDPTIIIIDEPQSFLHPGAARKLIDVLHEFTHHQFILTTHSPGIISATEARKIVLLSLDGQQSKVEQLDSATQDTQKRALIEVGAKLSDVFGMDGVLWVEGRTEEECFPLIMDRLSSSRIGSITIKGVRQTGDFEKGGSKRAKLTFDIYSTLSQGAGLLPPAVGFLFDTEEKSDKEKQDLRRQAKSVGTEVLWLERRMYENYLVDQNAICSILNELDGLLSCETIERRVAIWFDNYLLNGNKRRYWSGKDAEHRGIDNWFIHIHGGNFLTDLFTDVSKSRVAYDKVKHGIMLTKVLLESDPERFRSIADQLRLLLNGGVIA